MTTTVKTIIQLATTSPYKVIAEYDFLYQPLQDTKLMINSKEFHVNNLIDIIDENGSITRYIRFL